LTDKQLDMGDPVKFNRRLAPGTACPALDVQSAR